MKANSFQESDADTEGNDVIPRRMAKTKATTPETTHRLVENSKKLDHFTTQDIL